jgi:hypothetical protein
MSNANNNQASAQSSEYINCLTQGIGYASRVRLVTKSGNGKKLDKPFWAVKVNMMMGRKGEVEYLAYDLKSTSQQIDALLDNLKATADETKVVNGQEVAANKILFRITIGDATPHSYTLTKGARAGEQRLEMKGRVVRIHSIYVNDECTYIEPAKEAAAQPQAEAAPEQAQRTGTNG